MRLVPFRLDISDVPDTCLLCCVAESIPFRISHKASGLITSAGDEKSFYPIKCVLVST